MLMSWLSGFGFQCFTYQIKAKKISFILTFDDLNSDMQSYRYEENHKEVTERRQEQSSVTPCGKMVISWSSGIGFQYFPYQIKANEAGCILNYEDLNFDM